jgi:vacuolar protein sorting-associated protein 13D
MRSLKYTRKVEFHFSFQVLVTAPFWIINKSGLPLVFRQEGVPTETAAGQFEEHEVARMVAPLLFSFADHEASPTVVARVGSGVHPEGIPQVRITVSSNRNSWSCS